MRNIKLTIEYEGTDYSGWQFQKNGLSVQEVLQKALTRIAGEKINLKGASRTDAGVHALGQVANFKTQSDAPLRAFKDGLGSMLPKDILIRDAQEVDPDFDSIKSAVKKSYRYCIQPGGQRSFLTRRFVWNVWQSLNLDVMKEASLHLIGEKDFKAFQATDTDTKTSIRNMHSIDFSQGPMDLLYIDFIGEGFLKYMVRNIVGTLGYVGMGKIKEGEVKTILESKDRKKAGPTAPSCGLFLMKVYY